MKPVEAGIEVYCFPSEKNENVREQNWLIFQKTD